MLSLRQFLQSLRFAWRGLLLVARSEQNFRIQLSVAGAVGVLAMLFRIRVGEVLVLALVATAVLVLECINSAVERLLDLVQPRLHGYVREIKDMMAAAVLVASLGAALIGGVILLPYCWAYMVRGAQWWSGGALVGTS
ncbi:diacylglycerol kinase [Candidatus Uhrbacteria bacterium]|nr:diacylglycerol kinase [Candidatus Uhrbacteria bacterium]